MKIKLLFGLGGAIVGGALAFFIYTGGAYKRDALACSTEFNFTRNEGKANEVRSIPLPSSIFIATVPV